VEMVNGAKFTKDFVQPLYASYSFANIPRTIKYLLTGEGQSALPVDVFGNLPTHYNKVILFFVDAFGWRFFEHYAPRYSFLQHLLNEGVVSKLTSQFPSTTAAHTATIHTGLEVGQSGVYEWHYYEPLVDELITPLFFSYAGDKERDTLKRAGLPAEAFYPRRTFYQDLKSSGVASHIFQHEAYTPSTPSNIYFRGASVYPFRTLSDALAQMTELLRKDTQAPEYYFLYFDRIDAAGHQYGPHSEQFEQAAERFLNMMEQEFYQTLSGKLPTTLFMMTADHGQMEVSPQKTFYLNREAREIERYLKTNRKGKLLVPAGSARDMFLHIEDEHIDRAISYLQERLAGKAEVYRVQDLLSQHFFGLNEPSTEFLSRVGNVVILPYKHESVWWYEEGRFRMHFLGNHGGLTPEEMHIPLALLPL
jgi:predicted AlkP superfamily pyrophosphatase or phosphodiesterase